MPGWIIPLGAVLVAMITYVATVWLLDHVALPAGGNVERAKSQIETIRTGLSVGAGSAAALALILAVRRQWLAERTQQSSEYDAGEQRVTELYVKAADQLGSDKAPVRLAGLYALERLAQDHPHQRQTIVNVICAYLRMPYIAPSANSTRHQGVRRYGTMANRPNRAGEVSATDPYEELQVRLTAQRILTDHLTMPIGLNHAQVRRLVADATKKFWPDISLDLTGATLVDFDLSHARVGAVTFDRATFTGDARFGDATFTGGARFGDATFTGDAWFFEATFTGDARFFGATFTGDSDFVGATFTGDAWFGGATFTGEARFGGATFTGEARFGDATFTGGASFGYATFIGDVWFGGATFTGEARFGDATFTGDAWFGDATFTGDAWFGGATFTGDARFVGAIFTGDARFGGATVLNISSDKVYRWPSGWQIELRAGDVTTGQLVHVEQEPQPAAGTNAS